MKNIDIYTMDNCSYCQRAKDLLSKMNLNYNEFNVTANPDLIVEMVARSKGRTFPQIFINGDSIGGYDEFLLIFTKIGELAL